MSGTLLPAGPGWTHLPASIDGADITAHLVKSTRWGGADDGEDSGVTASGFSTVLHPQYLGVSLPQRGRGIKSMADCPIPRLPWFIPVKVHSPATGLIAYGHLIDIGPSKSTGHGLDCTNALIEALGLSLDDGVYMLNFRVIGGAAFLPKG